MQKGMCEPHSRADLTELELPPTMELNFPDPSNIMQFEVVICPDEGFYNRGRFRFRVQVNDNYPHDPPKVKCMQTVYHPNLDLDGNVCLNILREEWNPVLNLNSIMIGLLFLFLDPNPDDPLNKEAAEDLRQDKSVFAANVFHTLSGGVFNHARYDRVWS